MAIRNFDRHANMDSETRKMILEAIKDLVFCKSEYGNLENWLYGFFDGYDYSEKIIFSRELAQVTEENPELGAQISVICGIIEKYPTLQAA